MRSWRRCGRACWTSPSSGSAPGARTVGVREKELARGELVAVVPPGHPLAGREWTTLSRVARETFVDFTAGSRPAGSATRRSVRRG